MERFFRNLLLGENNELRNRYMVVNVPKELVTEQAQHDNRTSNRTSSRFVARLVKRTIVVEKFNGESRRNYITFTKRYELI